MQYGFFAVQKSFSISPRVYSAKRWSSMDFLLCKNPFSISLRVYSAKRWNCSLIV